MSMRLLGTQRLVSVACRRSILKPLFTTFSPFKRTNSATSTALNSAILSSAPAFVVPNAQEVASSITLPDTIPVHDIRLSDMGLAGYTPTGLFQQLIELFSVNGHVPFCASIIFSTVAIRLVLSPLASPLMRETSRFLESLPELGEGDKQRRLDIGGGKRKGRELMPEKILEGLDLDPKKLLLHPVFHVSMLATIYFGLKGMADVPVPQMIHGGFGWITNLSAPDPYHVLPISAPLLMMGAVKVNSVNSGLQYLSQTRFQPATAMVTMALIGITWNFPTALLLSWMSSNMFTICQACWIQRER